MALVSFRVLDGSDRGRVYDSLSTPVTIGREEGNSIQLNDERVSRFHLKIQEDQQQVVLTDLESTNGTKVNGEETGLRILRYGDMISVGRSVLLFGTRDEIAGRLAEARGGQRPEAGNGKRPDGLDEELQGNGDDDAPGDELLPPPNLPEQLTPAQAARLSELLSYLHIRLRQLLATSHPGENDQQVLDLTEWQNLLDLQAQLSHYIREIHDPHSKNEAEASE